jgi:hypothetical protein
MTVLRSWLRMRIFVILTLLASVAASCGDDADAASTPEGLTEDDDSGPGDDDDSGTAK